MYLALTNYFKLTTLLPRYRYWKESFSETVLQLPGVAEGFTRGLQLMHKASELKDSERARL